MEAQGSKGCPFPLLSVRGSQEKEGSRLSLEILAEFCWRLQEHVRDLMWDILFLGQTCQD